MEVFSNLSRLVAPGAFFWAAGIEDTFITHPWPATGRTLDEYELTQHYQRWRHDLNLFATLGVSIVRYGIPWHRINPAPGKWDWSFPDAAFEHLLSLGIQPIVDLVHYGLPPWIEGAYLHPDFPQRMAEYAQRTAERYKNRVYCYTPLNEPRITAWYCGKLGWWPPALRGWRGFLQVLTAVCSGIIRTIRVLREVDPEILPVLVDATDLYETADPTLYQEVEHRQEIVFLALDLISGRVTSQHSLYPWLLKHGVSETQLDIFRRQAVDLLFLGINLYPLFSRKVLVRSGSALRIRMPYATAAIVERLAQLYWDRYHVPLFISETASEGSIKRRAAWLSDSVKAVNCVRARGIPLVGYTWWPLFALVTWAYRQGHHPPSFYLKQMGLWDLREDSSGALQRIPTPLVAQYQALAQTTPPPPGRVRSPSGPSRTNDAAPLRSAA